MLNIERYRKELENYGASLDCDIHKIRENNEGIRNHLCISKPCSECRKENMQWLLEEYKEQILYDAEKKYLKAVINPFREKIYSISKQKKLDCEQIIIKTWVTYIQNEENEKLEYSFLPSFEIGKMYKGMKSGKEYTPEDLGL